MENLFGIVKRSFWEKITGKITVMYLDTEEKFLERDFVNYSLRAEYGHRQNEKYRLRAIRIKVSLLDSFKASSEKIYNRALICGYSDFKEVYDKTYKLIRG